MLVLVLDVQRLVKQSDVGIRNDKFFGSAINLWFKQQRRQCRAAVPEEGPERVGVVEREVNLAAQVSERLAAEERRRGAESQEIDSFDCGANTGVPGLCVAW